MKIYLASQWVNRHELRRFKGGLIYHGHYVTSRWIDREERPDDFTQEANRAREIANEDLYDLEAADTLLLYAENNPNTRNRGGLYVEFGIAMALGKRLFIIGPRTNVFTYLPEVQVWDSFNDFLRDLATKSIQQ